MCMHVHCMQENVNVYFFLESEGNRRLLEYAQHTKLSTKVFRQFSSVKDRVRTVLHVVEAFLLSGVIENTLQPFEKS